MPMKSASTTWFGRSRRNVRMTRGDSWLVASCNTSIVSESVDVAIVDSNSRAPTGPL